MIGSSEVESMMKQGPRTGSVEKPIILVVSLIVAVVVFEVVFHFDSFATISDGGGDEVHHFFVVEICTTLFATLWLEVTILGRVAELS